ncbi:MULTISPECIES: GNAT family N-acetyltransferase [unclassified Streptomyces]|uniref:GNAT family N-acetyltransferase n=1 Tax=unclassified Streptomyces TaxID=2593676 RepID=UPI001EFDBB9A|nr:MULTISPECIES: GNAT family N-acetyltransferase [unclassified Streptomyces]
MVGQVAVRQMDEEALEELLAVAVADAVPDEVMPPVAGPPGWTAQRREAFREWHRSRFPGLDGPLRESTFTIVHDGEVVGSARLALRDSHDSHHDVLETGMWLGRSQRGHGIGTAALRLLLDEAAKAGARTVVADTLAHNSAALGALRRNGATLTTSRDSVDVLAELTPRHTPREPSAPSAE